MWSVNNRSQYAPGEYAGRVVPEVTAGGCCSIKLPMPERRSRGVLDADPVALDGARLLNGPWGQLDHGPSPKDMAAHARGLHASDRMEHLAVTVDKDGIEWVLHEKAVDALAIVDVEAI